MALDSAVAIAATGLVSAGVMLVPIHVWQGLAVVVVGALLWVGYHLLP